ncbi:MAG: insulinase family protein, partial [Planctomycetes bacterium]|nr:insulinase family protein [Planctomycetota bacterium]
DFEKGMEILAEVVQTPRFAPEDFARERRLQINAVKSMDDSWEAEAQRFFRTTYFGNHPYALHPLGTAASLERMTVEEVSAYHRQVLAKPIIAVFGKVTRGQALEVAEKTFGNGSNGDHAMDLTAPASLPEIKPGAVSLKANNKTQVALIYGCRGVPYGGDDLPAIAVLDTIISGYGYPSGRLHEALRGSADLVYFVHAWNWPGLGGIGAFQIMTQTSPENLEKVNGIIATELQKICQEEVSAEELDSARESIVISEAIDNESLRARAMQATFDELYGVGFDFHQDFPDKVRAVTAEDVKRVAQKYLQDFILTATGPEEALKKLRPHKEDL